jgi:hypothetical protein
VHRAQNRGRAGTATRADEDVAEARGEQCSTLLFDNLRNAPDVNHRVFATADEVGAVFGEE